MPGRDRRGRTVGHGPAAGPASAGVAACVASRLLAAGPAAVGAPAAGQATCPVGRRTRSCRPPSVTAAELAGWFARWARSKATVSIDALADHFIGEGARRASAGDWAFAQAIVETGYFDVLRGRAAASSNNFSGLGAVDRRRGRRRPFPTRRRSGSGPRSQHLRRRTRDPDGDAARLAHPSSTSASTAWSRRARRRTGSSSATASGPPHRATSARCRGVGDTVVPRGRRPHRPWPPFVRVSSPGRRLRDQRASGSRPRPSRRSARSAAGRPRPLPRRSACGRSPAAASTLGRSPASTWRGPGRLLRSVAGRGRAGSTVGECASRAGRGSSWPRRRVPRRVRRRRATRRSWPDLPPTASAARDGRGRHTWVSPPAERHSRAGRPGSCSDQRVRRRPGPRRRATWARSATSGLRPGANPTPSVIGLVGATQAAAG